MKRENQMHCHLEAGTVPNPKVTTYSLLTTFGCRCLFSLMVRLLLWLLWLVWTVQELHRRGPVRLALLKLRIALVGKHLFLQLLAFGFLLQLLGARVDSDRCSGRNVHFVRHLFGPFLGEQCKFHVRLISVLCTLFRELSPERQTDLGET